ncbi:MAG TPA: FAD-binding and (Fe-S)-binding domain-containing protein [Devosia sp.]|nr:FAD-binding and (Fe-S)-binding domain-containing protein [Devosia sp.]
MTRSLDISHKPGGDRQTKIAPSGRIEAVWAGPLRTDYDRLGAEIEGAISGEVRFDAGSRALYATDASNYRQVPIGVVVPRSKDEVVKTIELCRKYSAPIVLRGGGTSLAGQGCNVAVLIDMSKYMHEIVSLDYAARRAIVQPGCVLDHLRGAAEKQHLTFGPDPATHDHNTLGGMLGNNSCGVHSIMSGRTSDNTESLEILTYDGLRMRVGPTSDAEYRAILAAGGRKAEIYRALDDFRTRYRELILAKYPKIPRRVSGYENLEQLLPENGFNVARALVGTEATCVTILEAELQLIPSPPERSIAIVGFEDVFAAADAVPDVLKFGPIACEGVDDLLVEFVLKKHLHADDLSVLPDGKGWLIVEFGADTEDEAAGKAQKLIDAYKPSAKGTALLRDREQQKRIWEVRDAALGATAHVPGFPETYPGWEDSAVHRDNLGDYLRDLKTLFHKYDYEASVYGHFGDGLVHCRVPFGLTTETGVESWRRFMDEAADLVVHYDGSLSGEHGDGQARAELLDKMYGAELVRAFVEFKTIWDPEGRMNPGKIVDPYPITSNLRAGPSHQPDEIDTYFAFKDDGGSFARATRRCVGVGSCRRRDSDKGVMCPSYMATNEEKHSTRGRARLLFEMLYEGPIDNPWHSSEVEEALDLCLSCKGCKSDCPVNTDMATYKAEFRAHYYKGRLRPPAAYSMGLIRDWSRFASHVPGLANFALQSPGLSRVIKKLAGVAEQRRMPRYADQTFVRWFRSRDRRHDVRLDRTVMLFPDTFNNYFRPETAIAATRVLEQLGYTVTIPDKPVCCGRPLYDWGMLDKARRLWTQTIDTLTPAIRLGIPIVGLEPACVSAFRDELPGLMGGNERAARLSGQMVFFTEFLDHKCPEAALPQVTGTGLVQMHCHHHAVIKTTSEEAVLKRLGLDYEIMKSGCCGMAGSFGFEADKYEVSMTAAERVLLPRLRQAPLETIVLANGFSCREQIEQGLPRKTQHIAELIASQLPSLKS